MPKYQTQKQQKQKKKEKSGIYKGTIKKKDLKEIKGVAYLEKQNGWSRKNSSPEQGQGCLRKVEVLYIICFYSLYYFIGLYVKIRNEVLDVLLNELLK